MNKIYALILAVTSFSSCATGQEKENHTSQFSNDSSISKMKIEIWSDIQCPFCYIGKRNLEAALAEFKYKDSVIIEWKSFQLDPTLPEVSVKGLDIYKLMAEKKGMSYDQIKKGHGSLTDWAKKVGLEYNFDKAIIVNSLKAHRIIQCAKEKGLGDKAEERFFLAYFTQGKDLSDTTTLFELGKEIGLKQAEVKIALTDSIYKQKVEKDIKDANAIGVDGVPFFLFNEKIAVSGAQSSGTFLKALEKSFNEWKSNNAKGIKLKDGKVCKPNGECK